MKQKYIFIAYSPKSDAGKDTVALLIGNKIKCKNVKFTEVWKRSFEEWLHITPGSLDIKAFRQSNVINTITSEYEEYTYNNIMYNWYHQLDNVVPGGWLYAGYLYRKLLIANDTICISDLRRDVEIEVLNRLGDRYTLVLLNIKGRGESKSTDGNLNLEKLEWDYSVDIDNSSDLKELNRQIDEMLPKVCLVGER